MAHGSWLLVAHGHDPWRFLFPDSNPEAQLRGVFLIRQTLLSHSDHEAQPWGDPKARILEAFRLTFRGCGGRAPTTHSQGRIFGLLNYSWIIHGLYAQWPHTRTPRKDTAQGPSPPPTPHPSKTLVLRPPHLSLLLPDSMFWCACCLPSPCKHWGKPYGTIKGRQLRWFSRLPGVQNVISREYLGSKAGGR
jgi:hypothetical protein